MTMHLAASHKLNLAFVPALVAHRAEAQDPAAIGILGIAWGGAAGRRKSVAAYCDSTFRLGKWHLTRQLHPRLHTVPLQGAPMCWENGWASDQRAGAGQAGVNR